MNLLVQYRKSCSSNELKSQISLSNSVCIANALLFDVKNGNVVGRRWNIVVRSAKSNTNRRLFIPNVLRIFSPIMSKKHTSIAEFYNDFSPEQKILADPIMVALASFGPWKLQWNMPVYSRENLIKRASKNQSRRYFGLRKCKTWLLYLWFYDINHLLTHYPHVQSVFDQVQKISWQVWIKTPGDVARAVALIELTKTV